MLKSIFCLSVCLCMFTLPSLAQLTPQDLKEIRTVVKEEVEKIIDKELTPIKADIVSLKTGFARLDGRLTGVEKQIAGVEKQIVMVANFVFALIALIVLAVGIPQIILAWRSRKNSASEKQIATLIHKQNEIISALTEEVETLRVKDSASEKQIAALIHKQNEMISALTEEVETLRGKVLSSLQ